jgi:hypothetical protein
MFAPRPIRISAVFSCLFLTAWCSGVRFFPVIASISAPRSRSSLTKALCPLLAAQCRDVQTVTVLCSDTSFMIDQKLGYAFVSVLYSMM